MNLDDYVRDTLQADSQRREGDATSALFGQERLYRNRLIWVQGSGDGPWCIASQLDSPDL